MNPASNKPVIFLAFANDNTRQGHYLSNLGKEEDALEKALNLARIAGVCEVVIKSNATLSNILDVFQNPFYRDRISLFHFGGHADGYQLLLKDRELGNRVAKGEGLVSFFAKQKSFQLIFCNGCSTQQQAKELSEAGIPVVIGT